MNYEAFKCAETYLITILCVFSHIFFWTFFLLSLCPSEPEPSETRGWGLKAPYDVIMLAVSRDTCPVCQTRVSGLLRQVRRRREIKYPKVINLPEWANFYVLTIQFCLCCYILPNLDKLGWIGVEDEVEALSTRNSVQILTCIVNSSLYSNSLLYI